MKSRLKFNPSLHNLYENPEVKTWSQSTFHRNSSFPSKSWFGGACRFMAPQGFRSSKGPWRVTNTSEYWNHAFCHNPEFGFHPTISFFNRIWHRATHRDLWKSGLLIMVLKFSNGLGILRTWIRLKTFGQSWNRESISAHDRISFNLWFRSGIEVTSWMTFASHWFIQCLIVSKPSLTLTGDLSVIETAQNCLEFFDNCLKLVYWS